MQKYCRTITTTLHDYIVAAAAASQLRARAHIHALYNLIYFHQKTSLSHTKKSHFLAHSAQRIYRRQYIYLNINLRNIFVA